MVFAKLLGFSEALVRQIAFVNQILTAYGVFLVLGMRCSRPQSLLGACLCITAREPWLLGFFIQLEINFFTVFILYFALRFIHREQAQSLLLSALLTGTAFIYDQRALFLAFIPLAAWFLRNRDLKGPRLVSVLALYALPALLCLAYLFFNNALTDFCNQSIKFPSEFRAGSNSFIAMLKSGVWVHRYLLLYLPIHVFGAVLGATYLARNKRNEVSAEHRRFDALLLAAALPHFIMPLLGGRDFFYYVLTWHPYLSILAALSPALFGNKLRVAYLTCLMVPIALSVTNSLQNKNYGKDAGDGGTTEVVNFLRESMKSEESLFVWGYRLDLYVRLKKLSPYPFADQMTIHPDQEVKGRENRQRHIFPAYEQRFLSLIESSPPDYIVFYNNEDEDFSPANEKLRELSKTAYTKVYDRREPDFRGVETHFEVFRRND